MGTPLPVTDLLNNLIITNNYLRASQTVRLAPFILRNPAYSSLVDSFKNWQYAIWSQYFEGLVDGNVTAQPEEIAKLYSLKAATQDGVKGILFPSGGSVPGVVSLCDDVASLITQGGALVTQLETIAQSIQGADQKLVDKLQAQSAALDAEFDKQEDELTDAAIGSAIDLVSCAIDVAVAVGTEGEVIEPLANAVTKIGQDAITELTMTDSINATLKELEATWAALDRASADLAQVTLTVNQLNAVVANTSPAMAALQAVVTDWSQVADTATESQKQWTASGKQLMNEWSSRMVKVSFTTASQTLQAA